MNSHLFIQNYYFLIILPFIIQALAITVDEFYFHHKRGLGKWERLGHPLDTLTVLSVYIFCFVWSFNPSNLLIFIALSFFSCVFVTKDEFVHNKLCCGSEQWLHGILFLVHSLTFVALGYLWSLPKLTILFSTTGYNINSAINTSPLTTSSKLMTTEITGAITIYDFIIGQIFILSAFVIYQIVFWNFNFIKRSLWTNQA